MSEGRTAIRRALVSVYDKTDLVALASALADAGVEIVSTGSTARHIADLGIPVTAVTDVTGFPECLDGRVKTLHPHIHAGLLADLRNDEHRRQLDELSIQPFELVVVNLYPFTETVASGASTEECVEQIDIGGPAMVRASAKNHANVAVVVSPRRYGQVIDALGSGGFTFAERRALAAEAFAHTASYDTAVATWMGNEDDSGFSPWTGASWQRRAVLRYGENPHQEAALYVDTSATGGLARARQLHGKEMSYNNYVDADAAWRAAHDFFEPAVSIIKHANPCGIAVGDDIAEAYAKAFATDPVSAFGGVVAANRPVTAAMATAIGDVFTEVVVAPAFDDDALQLLMQKKNIRLLTVEQTISDVDIRVISGGALVQQRDNVDAPGDDPPLWRMVCGDRVSSDVMADLAFAWRAVRSVKSNAILLAKDGAAVGVGMGQVNRVDSAKLAVERAGAERASGSVAASDAFFPFPDGLQVLADAGVRVIVQPGGSVRDEEVIAAAQAAGITMYLTGTRHFFH